MNLLELSTATNMPLDTLKDMICKRFAIVVLSDHALLRQDIVQTILSDKIYQAKKNDTDIDIKIDKLDTTKCPENNKDEELLKQLEQTFMPELIYTRKLLEYCVEKEFLFIIDICSLLHQQFYAFYDLFKSAAQRSGTKMIVPYVVTEEMKRMLIRRNKEQSVLERCEEIMTFLLLKRDAGRIEIVDSEDNMRTNQKGEKSVHADSLLLEKLMYFRNDAKSILLITQDHGFSVDALHLNNLQSSIANAVILVKKITERGALVDNAADAVCPSLPISEPQFSRIESRFLS